MSNWKLLSGVAAASLFTAAIVAPAEAQVTTSSIRGQLSTEAGTPVVGADVVIRHEPSGTVSTASSNNAGVFSARGLRVGGPYTVSITGDDFRPVEVSEVYLTLDDTYGLDLTIDSDRTLETVVVTAAQVEAAYLNTGASTSLSLEQLQEVVSIDRDITDAAQLDPFASVNVQSGGEKELSIAGANNRFNSLTIDGVALNDRFGLNANGYPTQRSPIPYEAIEQLQIETAPYDTEFNGFTGGTINAVTKSGTNEFHGSLFGYYTSDDYTGSSIRGDDVSLDFEEKTWGFTLGGPIIKDRLFFFAAYDKFEETALLQTGPEGSGALNEIAFPADEIAEIQEIAQTVYGFNTGSFSSLPPAEDEKILAKFDFNITNSQRATFTYIKTEGNQIQEQNGNNFIQGADLAFPSSWYDRSETVESYIGQLFSDWTDNFSTELKIAYTEQATGQDSLFGAEFPVMSVPSTADPDLVIAFGPDRFRHGNELDQEFFQVKAKAEYVAGDHTFKVGFESETVDVDNLFAQNSEGTYAFDSIDDLRNRIASEVTYDNAITNDENDLRAIWGYTVNSIYAQDVWDINNVFTLQAGFRYDWYSQDGEIRENQNFINRYGYSNTKGFDDLDGIFLPRVSFTWDAMDNLLVRGGIGKFSGGSPNVWISNSFSNDGVISDSVGADGPLLVPNSPDPVYGQYIPQDLLDQLETQAPDGAVNALDPSFQIPTTTKANIGVAYTFDQPYVEGLTLSADVLYNKLNDAPFWYDARCERGVGRAPDGRPLYSCDSSEPEAIVIGSIDKGQSLLFAVSAQKDFDFGLDLFASYTHADVRDIGMGTSSTATSNYSDTPRWSYQYPRTGTSNFQVEHLFKLRASYEREFIPEYASKISMFATRRSGQPYSYTFNENNNCVFEVGGGRCAIESRVDDAGSLLYVPSGPNDPLFSAASFGGNAAAQQAFFDYINSTELKQYKGGIAERNGDNSRWSTIVDLRFEQEFPGLRRDDRTKLFVDIENVGNLLNDEWGVVERTRYEYDRKVVAAQISPDGTQYIYNNLDSPNRINDKEILQQSLWQIQFGLKYEF